MKVPRRFRRRSGRTPMTATVARLLAKLRGETGREPTDHDLARILAISPTRIAHHRRLIDGGAA